MKHPMLNVALVTVNYRSELETVESVLSFRQHYKHATVVIVDNSCSSDLEVALAPHLSFINPILIRPDENLGYFRGLQLGIDLLCEKFADIDYIIVANNDIIYGSTILRLEHAHHELISKIVISPQVIEQNGRQLNPHVYKGVSSLRLIAVGSLYSFYPLFRFASFFKNLIQFRPWQDDASSISYGCYISQGHGSCYILTSRYIKEIGSLPVKTFLYGEEFFLSEQLSHYSSSVWFEPSIRVIHKKSKSVSLLPSRQLWKFQKIAFWFEIRERFSKSYRIILKRLFH